MSADGAYVSGSAQRVTGPPGHNTIESPQVAYNPDNGKTLVTYRYEKDDVHGKLVQGHSLSSEFSIGSRETDATLDDPRVAYDPVHASWLAAWSGPAAVNFQALRDVGPGSALSFDGVDDHVNIPDDSSIDFATGQDFTVELWVKPASEQQNVQFIDNSILEKWSEGGGYPYVVRYLNLTAGSDLGKVAVGRYDGANNPHILSSQTINDGQFHHVAFVKDGDTLYLYVDGQEQGTTPDTTTGDTTNDSPLFIGQRGPGRNRLTGLIDEVRVWNTVRTGDQIQAAMDRALTGDEAGLVGYWRLDEGAGDTAHDQTAKGNHGTLVNGPTWTTDQPFVYSIYPVGSQQRYTWASELSSQGTALACTMPLGPRALWLRFDQIPDTSLWTDYSGNGNDGSCSACPDVGAVGQAGEAVRFNGVDDYVTISLYEGLNLGDEFTLSAWVRPASDYGQEQAGHIDIVSRWGAGGPGNAAYLLGLNSAGQALLWTHDGSVTSTLTSETTIPANAWSHIVGLRQGTTLKLYVNGDLDNTLPDAAPPQASHYELRIGAEPAGGNHFSGLVDEVVVFDQALSEGQVQEFYDGTYDAACALTTNDAPGAGDALYYDRLNLRWPVRWMGVIESPNPVVVPVTIDADPPTTSTLTSLTDGQHIRYSPAQDILTIGGIAHDADSGVDHVEVEAGGAWQPATGAESWAYNWQVPSSEGPHTLRTRATDNVGHVFTETTPLTVIVDKTPPAVTSEIVNYSIISPTRDAQGRWIVPLHGEYDEPLAGAELGSGVQSVEVLLEGQEGGVAGNGWQTATLSGGPWAGDWGIDYVLPLANDEKQALADPTGVYFFYVRATDNVGNRTPDGALVGIDIRVDAAPPVAALTYTGPSTATITQTLTLRGVVTDTVGDHTTTRGLAGLDIAFIPADTDLNLGDWNANYYNNVNLSDPIMLSRTDPAIDFDWGYGSPHPLIVTDTFSVRWEQEATFKVAGTYRFETYNDNGVRVYVDGNPVLDAWADQWDATHVTDTYVTTGTHTLRVEYYHKSPLDLEGVPVSQPAIVRLAVSL
ncbi:MAG: PA14 domain-containing protein, partial [Anaerolineae bacterium]